MNAEQIKSVADGMKSGNVEALGKALYPANILSIPKQLTEAISDAFRRAYENGRAAGFKAGFEEGRAKGMEEANEIVHRQFETGRGL